MQMTEESTTPPPWAKYKRPRRARPERAQQDGPTLPRQRGLIARLARWGGLVGCIIYLLALGAATYAIWNLGDRWWPATVLIFAPRWTLALPLILLLPAAALLHRRSLITLAAAVVLLVWPILDLRIPLHSRSPQAGTP